MKSSQSSCHPDRKVWARGFCKSCYNKWLMENNPEYAKKQKENHKRWVAKHKDEVASYIKQWRMKQDELYNHIRKLKQYGLTPEDYNNLLKSQNGVCAICLKPPKKNRLAVDHCHKTGKIRGLLCFRCNFGMSFFYEDLAIIDRLYKYLNNRRDEPIGESEPSLTEI